MERESDGWGEAGRWKDANLTAREASGSGSAPPPPPPPPVKQREQRG